MQCSTLSLLIIILCLCVIHFSKSVKLYPQTYICCTNTYTWLYLWTLLIIIILEQLQWWVINNCAIFTIVNHYNYLSNWFKFGDLKIILRQIQYSRLIWHVIIPFSDTVLCTKLAGTMRTVSSFQLALLLLAYDFRTYHSIVIEPLHCHFTPQRTLSNINSICLQL